MSGFFGVDSASDARPLLARVTAAFGKIAFWGRYLPIYAITADEVAAIHAQGTAILPLWNRDQAGAMISSGRYDLGYAEGLAAVEAWKALGLPAGCVIITDVETDMYLSGAALQGWIVGVDQHGYVPGVYLNPVNGNNHAAGYRWAREQTAMFPCVHYTSQRELFSTRDVAVREFIVDGTTHAAAVPGFEAECAYWQTWENTWGAIDLDCARDLTLMWHPAPVAPVVQTVYHVVQPGALKAHPNHGPGVALGTNGEHLDRLEPGTTLTRTGADVVTNREHWLPCRLDRPDQVAHGYYPLASVK